MGYLCKQGDHLWGYSCAYLNRRLRANGFLCDITPSNVTLAEEFNNVDFSKLPIHL